MKLLREMAKYQDDGRWYDDEELFNMLNMPADDFWDALEGMDTYRGFEPEDWCEAMNDVLEQHNQAIRVTNCREGDDFMEWQIAYTKPRPTRTKKKVAKKKARRLVPR